MIRHKLFSKGDHVNALITNNRHSNIVFLVKAIIHDVEFNDKMPRYKIRITRFYDDIDFLKRYWFDMKFDKNFDGGYTVFRMLRQRVSNVKEFQAYLDSKWESYTMIIDSVMCVRTKVELDVLYNNIQDFLVERNIKELYELTTRYAYNKGTYKYESKGVFVAHLKKFLGDRAGKEKDYYFKLLYRPLSVDYDNLE